MKISTSIGLHRASSLRKTRILSAVRPFEIHLLSDCEQNKRWYPQSALSIICSIFDLLSFAFCYDLSCIQSTSPPETPREEEEGEDLLENVDADYKAQPELDTYDEDDIDDADISPMALGQRRDIDALLAERDRRTRRGRRGYLPQQLLDDDDEIPEALRRGQADEFAEFATEQEESLVNLEDFDGPLREWLDEDRVRREIKNRFKSFLTSFSDPAGTAIYPVQIRKMCQGICGVIFLW